MNNTCYLPDSYAKKKDSNHYKLLELTHLAVKDIQEDIHALFECLDLYQAKGKILELYGDMLDQERGFLNDVQFRYMILMKIGCNTIHADYQSIMDAIVLMFNCNQGDVSLDDFEVADDLDTPCIVKLTKFPIQILLDAGFTSKQAVGMINRLLPVCVTLAADNFEGTFCFAETSEEYDKKAGFSNEEGSIGGTLGLRLGEDEESPILPF